MAAKKRSAKRKKTSNPKKRSHAKRKHHRKAAANPKKRKKTTRTRKRAANPKKRSHKRRATHHTRARRAHAANPGRRHKRRHKRNPGIPAWALAGLAGALGVAVYAIGQAGSFAITQRTDPSRATLDRNRYIGFGVLTAIGIGLAAFSKSETVKLLAVGVTGGGLVGLAGTELSLALGRVIDKTDAPAKLSTTGVFANGQQQFGAVYGGGRQQFGAVFGGGQQQFGNIYDNASMAGG